MILLTGASGFLGKALLKQLIAQEGAGQLLALSSQPIEGITTLLHKQYTFTDAELQVLHPDAIETIIHAGAFIPKSGQELNDVSKCSGNITSTERLLRAPFPRLKRIIFISSVDVYGPDSPISERSPIAPPSLYGASKVYCERMISAWANARGCTHQILRLGHVYGPGEEAFQKLIPLVMRQMMQNKTIKRIGSGEELRSFIYIDDVVAAILNAVQLPQFAGEINIAGDEAISINALFDRLAQLNGKQPEFEFHPATQIPRNLVFDNQKMKEVLHVPRISLTEGLEREWEYMKQWA
jgi:UDP-glucose 4-epimerase